MDAINSFLDGPRARQAFLLRTVMDPPWAMRIQDEAPLTAVCLLRGHAIFRFDDGPTHPLDAGDIALIRGPQPYTLADAVDTKVQITIHPGQRCETVRGEPLADAMGLGVRTWGNDPHGSTVMLTGTYTTDSELSRPLLNMLPDSIVLRDGDWSNAATALLADEMVIDGAGQAAILDRLLDVVVVTGLRQWATQAETSPPGWYRAQSDELIGPAIRALHEAPGHPWTVGSIAQTAGLSRAALARRFVDIVGDTPIAYLTSVRLALAADLLLDGSRKIAQIATEVGYGSPFALSTAFKRAYGVSPRGYRTDQRLRLDLHPAAAAANRP